MAQFLWRETPIWGVCVSCGASVCERGFVDMIAETNVKSEGEIVGIVDVVMCGTCLEQAGEMVGMKSSEDARWLEEKYLEVHGAADKLKDEVQAWQQRYQNLIDVISSGSITPSNADSDIAPTSSKRNSRADSGLPKKRSS